MWVLELIGGLIDGLSVAGVETNRAVGSDDEDVLTVGELSLSLGGSS